MKKIKSYFKKYRNLNWTLVDQIMVSGANFLTTILVARFLGLNDFGVFSLLWMSILFIQSIQKALIIMPMVSIAPKQSPDDRPSYYGAVITHQILFSLVSTFLIYLGLIISHYYFPQWKIIDYSIFLLISLFLSQNQDFIRRLLFIEERVLTAFVNDLITYFGRIILLTLFFLESKPSINLIFFAFSLSLFFSVLVGCFTLFKPSFNLKSIFITLKRHWKMSKYLIGSALMQWTSGNYFIIVAGVLLGPVSVGALRASSNIIGITNILLQGLENIAPQSASKHLISSGIFGLNFYLKKIFLLGGSAILLIVSILILFSSEILVTLYGDDYSQYSYILVWYSIISFIVFSLTPLFIGLRTLENTKPIFISYLISTIFSVFAANFLIKEFEVNGVMFGILTNNLIMVFISYKSFLKTCRIQLENDNNILK